MTSHEFWIMMAGMLTVPTVTFAVLGYAFNIGDEFREEPVLWTIYIFYLLFFSLLISFWGGYSH